MLVILQQDFKQLEKKQTRKQDHSLLCKYPMKLLGLFVTEPQAAVTPWKAGLKSQLVRNADTHRKAASHLDFDFITYPPHSKLFIQL